MFGFIFLVKAAGLSSEDISKKLHERLPNYLAIDRVIVHEQLAGLALLRRWPEVQT